eukprot:3456874-Pleurochrysis_carterae.AAC.4
MQVPTPRRETNCPRRSPPSTPTSLCWPRKPPSLRGWRVGEEKLYPSALAGTARVVRSVVEVPHAAATVRATMPWVVLGR